MSLRSIGFHGIHGIRGIQWNPWDSMGSMDSMGFHGIHGSHSIHGFHGIPWNPWNPRIPWNPWFPWNPWIPCQLTKDSKYEMRLSCGVCWETFWHPTMNPYGSSSNQFSPKFKWFLRIFGRTPMGTPIETLMKSSCSSPWESS